MGKVKRRRGPSGGEEGGGRPRVWARGDGNARSHSGIGIDPESLRLGESRRATEAEANTPTYRSGIDRYKYIVIYIYTTTR
jgi:hypothetical protein